MIDNQNNQEDAALVFVAVTVALIPSYIKVTCTNHEMPCDKNSFASLCDATHGMVPDEPLCQTHFWMRLLGLQKSADKLYQKIDEQTTS